MTVRIINADVLDGLRQLPDESVHCVVTSPPYFGLRDYGTATWIGGDSACAHSVGGQIADSKNPGAIQSGVRPGIDASYCRSCGAERIDRQMGLEPTPDDYVSRMVETFREVRRVLRSDGNLWLNVGDSYAGSWGAQSRGDDYPGTLEGGSTLSARQIKAHPKGQKNTGSMKKTPGLKPKDLIGVPWMLAFALRSDGWWLRSANVWAKPNGMPESVEDRPTVAHEYVFQLTKSERYFYNAEGVRLPPVPESVGRLARAMRNSLDEGGFVISGGGYAPPGQAPHQGARKSDKQRGHSRKHAGFNDRWDAMERAEQQSKGANLRSVWWISPGGFPEAHFAVMPEELAATCIMAGTQPGGVVLDPFGGSGTVGVVADRLRRSAILIELNPDYAAMAQRRIAEDRGALLDLMEAGE